VLLRILELCTATLTGEPSRNDWIAYDPTLNVSLPGKDHVSLWFSRPVVLSFSYFDSDKVLNQLINEAMRFDA